MCVIYEMFFRCILTQGTFDHSSPCHLALSHPGKSTSSWKSKLGRPSAQKQNVGRLEENGHSDAPNPASTEHPFPSGVDLTLTSFT